MRILTSFFISLVFILIPISKLYADDFSPTEKVVLQGQLITIGLNALGRKERVAEFYALYMIDRDLNNSSVKDLGERYEFHKKNWVGFSKNANEKDFLKNVKDIAYDFVTLKDSGSLIPSIEDPDKKFTGGHLMKILGIELNKADLVGFNSKDAQRFMKELEAEVLRKYSSRRRKIDNVLWKMTNLPPEARKSLCDSISKGVQVDICKNGAGLEKQINDNGGDTETPKKLAKIIEDQEKLKEQGLLTEEKRKESEEKILALARKNQKEMTDHVDKKFDDMGKKIDGVGKALKGQGKNFENLSGDLKLLDEKLSAKLSEVLEGVEINGRALSFLVEVERNKQEEALNKAKENAKIQGIVSTGHLISHFLSAYDPDAAKGFSAVVTASMGIYEAFEKFSDVSNLGLNGVGLSILSGDMVTVAFNLIAAFDNTPDMDQIILEELRVIKEQILEVRKQLSKIDRKLDLQFSVVMREFDKIHQENSAIDLGVLRNTYLALDVQNLILSENDILISVMHDILYTPCLLQVENKQKINNDDYRKCLNSISDYAKRAVFTEERKLPTPSLSTSTSLKPLLLSGARFRSVETIRDLYYSERIIPNGDITSYESWYMAKENLINFILYSPDQAIKSFPLMNFGFKELKKSGRNLAEFRKDILQGFIEKNGKIENLKKLKSINKKIKARVSHIAEIELNKMSRHYGFNFDKSIKFHWDEIIGHKKGKCLVSSDSIISAKTEKGYFSKLIWGAGPPVKKDDRRGIVKNAGFSISRKHFDESDGTYTPMICKALKTGFGELEVYLWYLGSKYIGQHNCPPCQPHFDMQRVYADDWQVHFTINIPNIDDADNPIKLLASEHTTFQSVALPQRYHNLRVSWSHRYRRFIPDTHYNDDEIYSPFCSTIKCLTNAFAKSRKKIKLSPKPLPSPFGEQEVTYLEHRYLKFRDAVGNNVITALKADKELKTLANSATKEAILLSALIRIGFYEVLTRSDELYSFASFAHRYPDLEMDILSKLHDKGDVLKVPYFLDNIYETYEQFFNSDDAKKLISAAIESPILTKDLTGIKLIDGYLKGIKENQE